MILFRIYVKLYVIPFNKNIMGILNFDKINKKTSSKEHINAYQSDCWVPGTYMPNMSEEDNYAWKGKHVWGENERVEIRKCIGAQMLLVVHKDWTIDMSANGKMNFIDNEFNELFEAVSEAKEILHID